MTKAVIARLFVIIAENFVRLAQFLETLGGLIVARVAVGMQFHGLAAIGFFYFLRTGGAVDAQHFIIIAFGHLWHFYDNLWLT